MIDFKRTKDGVGARVAAIEYDPNRTCRIALLHYEDGDKAYILAPRNVKVGDRLMSGQGSDIRPGNALPLRYIPVGTVDRFQGQERPVVLYSLASSSALDAPRGLPFLYDLHRLNVATSRAQCACVLIGSPALFEPECRTPDQIRLANGLCRYRELATVVPVP